MIDRVGTDENSKSARLGLPKDPSVSGVECVSESGDVVATKTRGLFPLVAVAEEAGDSDRVAETIANALLPDLDFDQAVANFVGGLTGHRLIPGCPAVGVIEVVVEINWLRAVWERWPVGEPTGRKPIRKTC
jgi:hypothetical protein